MSNTSEALLELRQQPLLELVNSEENYVRQLQMVRDTYMTVVSNHNLLPPAPYLTRSESCRSERLNFARKPPSTPKPSAHTSSPPFPPPPSELANRWRVIWGNWIQLTEWHSQFVEKLRRAVHEQPDNVPRLFLNSQSRLRSMYMKYCENYSKAVVLVAPFKAYFEDLRRFFFDKNDILSRLMQPIQRVTRYHLPMTEALKLTEQAGPPDCAVWRAAVAVLKNLPNDVQLMLEAARIQGFPGSVTNQGSLRLYGAMNVAFTTHSEIRTAQTVSRQMRTKLTSHSFSQDSSSLVVKRRAMTSPSFMRLNSEHKNIECSHCRLLAKCCSGAQKSIRLRFMECRVFLFDQCLIIAEDTPSSPATIGNPPEVTSVNNTFEANFGKVIYGSGSHVHQVGGHMRFSPKPQRPQKLQSGSGSHTTLGSAGRSPITRRMVHIRRHGSHLGSLDGDSGSTWLKASFSAQHDPFRQSNYKFLHSVKVNRMAFTSHWLSQELNRVDSVDHSTKASKSTESEISQPILGSGATKHVCTATETTRSAAPDCLWFAVIDEAPSSEMFLVLDPGTEVARDAWLRELRDIAVMQEQLQLALQNPRRFHYTSSSRRQAKTLSSIDMTALYPSRRGDQKNAFLSAHSSITQLVDSSDGGGESASGDDKELRMRLREKGDAPLHVRGLSAPQPDSWNSRSENPSLEAGEKEDPSLENSHRLCSPKASHDSSVPDIVQTPDDVFLPDIGPPKSPTDTGDADSNLLQLPAETLSRTICRRSLSHSDAKQDSDRSQPSRQHAIHVSTPSPGSTSDQSSTGAVGAQAPTTASQKKKILAAISSRFRDSDQVPKEFQPTPQLKHPSVLLETMTEAEIDFLLESLQSTTKASQ